MTIKPEQTANEGQLQWEALRKKCLENTELRQQPMTLEPLTDWLCQECHAQPAPVPHSMKMALKLDAISAFLARRAEKNKGAVSGGETWKQAQTAQGVGSTGYAADMKTLMLLPGRMFGFSYRGFLLPGKGQNEKGAIVGIEESTLTWLCSDRRMTDRIRLFMGITQRDAEEDTETLHDYLRAWQAEHAE